MLPLSDIRFVWLRLVRLIVWRRAAPLCPVSANTRCCGSTHVVWWYLFTSPCLVCCVRSGVVLDSPCLIFLPLW
ncbi:hypothetical protein JOB18_004071 [Solea senegalensis]|uniref:Secreted protein n=1 Tax=Solea senegalensis TaxID=28829 RepID=A0AAV6Q6F3_SOLSE|nr:hypothetical protein JOB18_004071 [Solea senegalensis]